MSRDFRNQKSQERVGKDESLELVQRHMIYAARQQRMSAPPRCHPLSIYVLVQGAGCLFIGLTMIITAHWPGTSSRSSNILKIFGPILIVIGAILLVIGILVARYFRKREAKTWDKKMSQHILSASRQVLDQSIPTYSAQARQMPGLSTEDERKELLESPQNIEMKLMKKAAKYSDTDTPSSSLSALPGAPFNNEDVPDPVRIKKPKKKAGESLSSLENLHSLKEEDPRDSREHLERSTSRDEHMGETFTRKTTKTTTVVTRRIVEDEDAPVKPKKRPKPPPVPQKPSNVPDSPRLRVKVKASLGTSVNIRHSGSSHDEQASEIQQSQKKPSKPKSKSKKQQEFRGTNI